MGFGNKLDVGIQEEGSQSRSTVVSKSFQAIMRRSRVSSTIYIQCLDTNYTC